MWSSFFALWFGLLCLQRLSLGKHRPSDLSWVNFGAVGATGLSSPWNKHSIVGTGGVGIQMFHYLLDSATLKTTHKKFQLNRSRNS